MSAMDVGRREGTTGGSDRPKGARRLLRDLGRAFDLLGYPIGIFFIFSIMKPADNVLVPYRSAIDLGVLFGLIAAVLVRGKFARDDFPGPEPPFPQRLFISGNLILLGACGAALFFWFRGRALGHVFTLLMLFPSSSASEVRLNFHGWKSDDNPKAADYLEVSWPESPERRMYIRPYEGRKYVRFQEPPHAIVKAPRQVSAMVLKGALNLRWVDPKSLSFVQHLYDMPYWEAIPGESVDGRFRGSMDHFRGKAVLFVVVGRCRTESADLARNEALALRRRFPRTELAMLGFSRIEPDCPKVPDSLAFEAFQELGIGLGSTSFLTTYVGIREPESFRSYLFDRNGNFVAQFGDGRRFDAEEVGAAISAVLKN